MSYSIVIYLFIKTPLKKLLNKTIKEKEKKTSSLFCVDDRKEKKGKEERISLSC